MLRAVSRALVFQNFPLKSFHTSALLRLREITEKQDGKTTIIDCKYVKSPREPYLIKMGQKDGKCPLCRLKLNLKHTDVLILSQYIDSNGNIMSHKDTNLCKDQYQLVRKLIFMAQYAGLLPEPPRSEPKKPYHLLNTYFDESTIKLHFRHRDRDTRFMYLKRNLGPIERFRIKPQFGVAYKTLKR